MILPQSECETFTGGTAQIERYRAAAIAALNEIPAWQVAKAAKYIRKTHQAGGTVWCAGNGGSQANAAHLSLHLQECGIRAVEFMGEAALSSAFANDATYEASLAKRLRLLSRPSDLLIVLTGSGNSINIITALAEARRLGLDTIGLLGFGGGMAKGLCRVPIVLTATSYGPVEDAHSAVVHMLAGLLSDDDAKRGPALAR